MTSFPLLNELRTKTQELHSKLVGTMTDTEAMGAAYVIEGSTLGGKILHKRLKKQDFIANANALSYFSFYKENTWSDYISWLEKQSLQPCRIRWDMCRGNKC